MRGLLTILLTMALTVAAQGASLHARLVRASDEHPGQDARLRDIAPQLEKKFGYKHYRQLGAHRVALVEGKMLRLDLREGFVLFVTLKGVEQHEHHLDLEWYSGKALLVRSTVKIADKGQLFIQGPAVGNDWIVLALNLEP